MSKTFDFHDENIYGRKSRTTAIVRLLVTKIESLLRHWSQKAQFFDRDGTILSRK